VFLKSLDIKGFKSFAEATSIELEPGVAVIVGPNGSGKSNVVDAIAWVLGAQAPSAVRSQKMDDVIFAGTQSRPALGRAEVALTIDNSTGLLPIDFNEVTISRTLFRSGDSEYAINGVPCRLLDIQELLSDSGVGRQQHVIISQGQIDAVLNARPEDRRLIIEEAAGVLKYRRRKGKAERRLLATQDNLTRLQDLLREVRRQLRPLERQADAARRHGDVVSELAALRVHVAGRDIDRLRGRLESMAAQRADFARQDAELKRRLEELDQSVLATEAQLSTSGDEELNDALVEYESLREKARGQLALLAERRRGLERERDAFMDQGVVATLEAEAAQVADEVQAVDVELDELAPQLDEIEAIERLLIDLRERFESTVPGDFLPRQGSLDFNPDDDRSTAAPGVHPAPDERLDEELLEAYLARGRRTAEARNDMERVDDERRRAEADHRSWAAREEALALALDEARTRAGVDELTSIDGVLGTLLDLVEVDHGWEKAFEATVGDAIASVVVDGTESGRRAVEALRASDLAGLILAVDRRPAPPESPVGESVRSHVRTTSASAEPLLDRLLAGTVAVDGWSAAVDAVTAHPDAVVVTREGDRFGPRGWRIGLATGQATAAALEEASQQARAAVDHINEADRRGASARLALEEAEAAEEQSAELLRREVLQVHGRLARHAAAADGRRGEIDRRRAGLAERRELLESRLNELERRLEQKSDERDSVQRQRLELDRRQKATAALERYVVERVEQVTVVLDDLREQRRLQSEATKAVTQALAGLRRDRASAEKMLGELREQAQRTEIDEAESRLRLDTAIESLRTDLEVEPDDAVAAECPELEAGVTAKARIRELERDLRLMGPINPLALEEYEALQERHVFLQDQLDDVKNTRRDLHKVVKEVDREIMNVFTSAFADVAANFEQLFETLFPGGRGRLKLTDPDNLLDTGIEVEARPSGKNVRKLSLLSGGERSLTALAFLFAVFRSRPSPFYVMDEVEAALDDVNLHRFLDLVHEFRRDAQLLIVSHQKRTMEAADCLFGVTMKSGGSSRVVSEKIATTA
jgi:chromosome segregation protein